MTTAPARPPRSARRRRNPGWVPNQHGAWAMLAAPLLVGVLAGGPVWAHLLLAVFWFLGYFAFFATGLWLKSGRRQRWWPPVRTYVTSSGAAGAALALARPDLMVWAPAFAPPLAVGLWAAPHRHERDLWAGLTTVVAAALVTVVAYDTGTAGDLDRGWLLAAVQLLYFAATVFYVKSAIRERDNRAFLRLSVAIHVVAAVAVGWISWWLVPLFGVLALRAAAIPGRHLTPKQIGVAEIGAAVAVSAVSLLVV